jgi:hypothetical protein
MSETRLRKHQVGVRLDDGEYEHFAQLAQSGKFFGHQIPMATLIRELALRQVREIARKSRKAEQRTVGLHR